MKKQYIAPVAKLFDCELDSYILAASGSADYGWGSDSDARQAGDFDIIDDDDEPEIVEIEDIED